MGSDDGVLYLEELGFWTLSKYKTKYENLVLPRKIKYLLKKYVVATGNVSPDIRWDPVLAGTCRPTE
jgi:hypothetical protein